MKINAISDTNFRGLFVDKTKENGGNWRMEYHPYSWEVKMAPKAQFEWTDLTLPDNEELFLKYGKREVSQDILGTKSYIKNTGSGQDILRKTITEMPSLSFEESLKIKISKLISFSDTKTSIMTNLRRNLDERMAAIFDISKEHNKYALDLLNGFFTREYSKEASVSTVRKTFDKMTAIADETAKDFREYIALSESKNAVMQQIAELRIELEKIEKAKKTNSLIDISRRDVERPNEALIKAFEEGTLKGKLLALSHKTISAEEILKGAGQYPKIEKILNIVENLIKKKM